MGSKNGLVYREEDAAWGSRGMVAGVACRLWVDARHGSITSCVYDGQGVVYRSLFSHVSRACGVRSLEAVVESMAGIGTNMGISSKQYLLRQSLFGGSMNKLLWRRTRCHGIIPENILKWTSPRVSPLTRRWTDDGIETAARKTALSGWRASRRCRHRGFWGFLRLTL